MIKARPLKKEDCVDLKGKWVHIDNVLGLVEWLKQEIMSLEGSRVWKYDILTKIRQATKEIRQGEK